MQLSGMGQFRTCSTFPGSALIPSSVTTFPRYETRFWKTKYFFGLSFSPAQASCQISFQPNSSSNSSSYVRPMTITSSRQIKQIFQRKPFKTSSMNLVNVLGVLQRPNGISFHLYKPLGVAKAAFSWVFAPIATCQ